MTAAVVVVAAILIGVVAAVAAGVEAVVAATATHQPILHLQLNVVLRALGHGLKLPCLELLVEFKAEQNITGGNR